MIDTGVGSDRPPARRLSPGRIVPAATALEISVRNASARRTAPSMLSDPAPCWTRLAGDNGCAVYWRIALMSGGVRPGLACSISATVPVTTGAAIEVPLKRMSRVEEIGRAAWRERVE